MVVVLFGVLRLVLAMVGVIARVVIKVKIDSKNGFGIWLFNTKKSYGMKLQKILLLILRTYSPKI
jgi:hypothetical protein